MRSIVLVASCASVAARAAAADGNLTASVDSAGDLWVFGDELSNGLRIEAGSDDTDVFTIRGLDGTTTVNGVAQVTLFAPGTRMVVFLGDGNNVAWLGDDYGSDPSCCSRQLVVLGGAGHDQIVMIGNFPRVTADLGPGNDSVVVEEGASGISGSLSMGSGNDLISIDDFTGANGFFDLGADDDQFLLGRSNGLEGLVDLGTGNDFLFMEENSGTFELRGNQGDDWIEIERLESGSVTLDAGYGTDWVRITGDAQSSGSAPIVLDVDLGPQDDRLAVGSAEVATAVFDGGPGTDQYLDLGGNVWAEGAPALIAFELPKGTRGPAIDIVTTIVGRVLDERARAVPGAHVALPQLGLATSTDTAGAFAFASVADERHALELVVGATVDGRARSGATRVELAPLDLSDAGDVVLAPVVRNVLLLGTPLYRTSALESNLQELGYRPEEVIDVGGLPANLSPYGVIWHVGGAIASADRPRFVGFVRAGGGLFLSGGGNSVNASVEGLVNLLVEGGGIDVGTTGTNTDPFYSFQPGAAGGVATTPNFLTSFDRSAFSRFVTGLAARNELIVMNTSPDVPGVVWDGQDLVGHRGRVLLVTDSTWMVAGESLDVIENFQAFLARQPKVRTSR